MIKGKALPVQSRVCSNRDFRSLLPSGIGGLIGAVVGDDDKPITGIELGSNLGQCVRYDQLLVVRGHQHRDAGARGLRHRRFCARHKLHQYLQQEYQDWYREDQPDGRYR